MLNGAWVRELPRKLNGTAIVFGVVGLVLSFYPMLRSGFQLIPTDPGDSRLNNYQLEYPYRWLARKPAFENLWSPPFYYPTPDTAAYSDVQFASEPLYVPWRLLGFAPDTAFQLWLLASALLNYAAALLLLRTLALPWTSAVAGAYLIAFGLPRINNLSHPQLFSIYYISFALYGLVRLFQRTPESSARWPWPYVISLCLGAQLYSGFYMGWFAGLSMAVLAGAAICMRDTRSALSNVLLELRWHWLGAGLLGLGVLAPLGYHYLRVASVTGYGTLGLPTVMQPRLASWFYPGASWGYGWLRKLPSFANLPAEGEHRIGVGLAVTAVALFGLWRARRSPLARLAFLYAAVVILIATRWADQFSLWEQLVMRAVPGAEAIRAPVRIGQLMVYPAAIGLALCLRDFLERFNKWRALTVVPLVLLALDQGTTLLTYDKFIIREDVAALSAAIPADCAVFLFTPEPERAVDVSFKYHGDAMWASMDSGIPTVNGSAGRVPPEWFPFNGVEVRDEQSRSAYEMALHRWADSHHMDHTRFCIIGGKMRAVW